MAVVTITIPDTVVPRVRAAIRAQFPAYAALSDAATFQAVVADYVRTVVISYESTEAQISTQAQTRADMSGIG